MDITVTISDEEVRQLIQGELENIPKEKIQNAIMDSISDFMKNDEIIKSLFVQTNYNHWGTSTQEPTELLKNAAKNFDLNPAFKDIEDDMIKYIKENHAKIVENLLLKLFVISITKDYDFQNKLEWSIMDIMRNNNSN